MIEVKLQEETPEEEGIDVGEKEGKEPEGEEEKEEEEKEEIQKKAPDFNNLLSGAFNCG